MRKTVLLQQRVLLKVLHKLLLKKQKKHLIVQVLLQEAQMLQKNLQKVQMQAQKLQLNKLVML
jgi:hypothetical protein